MYIRKSNCLGSFVVLATLLAGACARSAPGLAGAVGRGLQPSVSADVVYGHKDGLALLTSTVRHSLTAPASSQS
jgi:hypothetical protein